MNRRKSPAEISTFLTAADAAALRRNLEFRRALGEYLASFLWHHFATLTFGHPPSHSSAMRLLRAWIRRLEQRAQERVYSFRVLERGAGGVLHLHVLTAGTGRLDVGSLTGAWSGGRANASTYDRRRGAAHYVTKAVTSDDVEYDLDLPPQPPPGTSCRSKGKEETHGKPHSIR